MNRKRGKKRTITGIVIPDDWDKEDNVIRVAIKTSDYEEYVVEYNKQGKQLLSMIDRTVCVKGSIRERLNGDFTVSVDNYQVIEGAGEDRHVTEDWAD